VTLNFFPGPQTAPKRIVPPPNTAFTCSPLFSLPSVTYFCMRFLHFPLKRDLTFFGFFHGPICPPPPFVWWRPPVLGNLFLSLFKRFPPAISLPNFPLAPLRPRDFFSPPFSICPWLPHGLWPFYLDSFFFLCCFYAQPCAIDRTFFWACALPFFRASLPPSSSFPPHEVIDFRMLLGPSGGNFSLLPTLFSSNFASLNQSSPPIATFFPPN